MTTENRVRQWLLLQGVGQKYRGFEQLVTAIQLCLEDRELLNTGITKAVYPAVGKLRGIAVAAVERNIRGAIRSSQFSHLTNLEFITRAICDIQMGEVQERMFYNYVAVVENGRLRFVTDYAPSDGSMCIRDGCNAYLFTRRQAVDVLDQMEEFGYCAVIIQATDDNILYNPDKTIRINGG